MLIHFPNSLMKQNILIHRSILFVVGRTPKYTRPQQWQKTTENKLRPERYTTDKIVMNVKLFIMSTNLSIVWSMIGWTGGTILTWFIFLLCELMRSNDLEMKDRGIHHEHVVVHHAISRCINTAIDIRAEDFEDQLSDYVEFVELALELQNVHCTVEETFLYEKVKNDCDIDLSVLLEHQRSLRRMHEEIEIVLVSIRDSMHGKATHVEIEIQCNRLRKQLCNLRTLLLETFKEEEEVLSRQLMNSLYSDQEQRIIVEEVISRSVRLCRSCSKTIPLFLYSINEEERKRYLRALPWIVRSFIMPYIWSKEYEKLTPYFYYHPINSMSSFA